MIRNIVFDMGQVLLCYDPSLPCLRHAKGDREVALTLRKAIFDCPEWVATDAGELNDAELLEAAQKRLPTPELKAIAKDIIADWYLDTLWPKQGMAEVTKAMHDRGYRLYILSNASLRFRDYQYKIPHLELFSGILVSAEEKLLKPDLAIYRRLCDKFSLSAEECLFIDDVPANVQGAKNAGMKAYCYADGDVNRLMGFLNGIQ